MLPHEHIANLSQDQKARHFENQLLKDVRNNHFPLIKETLEDVIKLHASSFSINAYDNEHETALYIACAKGYLEVVNMLLQCNGINVNIGKQINSWGVYLFKCCINHIPPLYAAIVGGHLEVVQTLIQDGRARYNFDYPTSAIQAAIENDRADIMEYLLTLSAINLQTKPKEKHEHLRSTESFEPPLFYAVQKSSMSLVNLLLAIPDLDIQQFAHYSSENSSTNSQGITQVISKHYSYKSPLVLAIENNNMAIFLRLIALPNINFLNFYSSNWHLDQKTETTISPLAVAIIHGKIGFADVLINDPRYDKHFGTRETFFSPGDFDNSSTYEEESYSTLDLAIKHGLHELAERLRSLGVQERNNRNASPVCTIS